MFYIQNNYQNIVSNLTNEKNLVDKYFLKYALQYYIDNGSNDDFNSSVSIRNLYEIMEPILIDNDEFEQMFVDENELIFDEIQSLETRNLRNTAVASVRVFSDPTKSTVGSSGLEFDFGTHSWITISNISNSNITVGRFSIAPNKTIALGTWGNKSEHKGLWYGLESYFISMNSAYSNRVSLRTDISSSSLSTLNNHINGYDKWSHTTNCSSFAVSSWNSISSTKLSAGVINTPLNLSNSIKNISWYSTKASVPHHYKVYYANGSGSPKLSTAFN